MSEETPGLGFLCVYPLASDEDEEQQADEWIGVVQKLVRERKNL